MFLSQAHSAESGTIPCTVHPVNTLVHPVLHPASHRARLSPSRGETFDRGHFHVTFNKHDASHDAWCFVTAIMTERPAARCACRSPAERG